MSSQLRKNLGDDKRAESLRTSSYLLHFFSGVADDGELPQLVVISLFFFSNVADDSELKGLSPFLSFFLKCRR
jgi:hypothetical protein